VDLSETELSALIPALLQTLGAVEGYYFAPEVVRQVITTILEGQPAQFICDPWAGPGVIIATIHDATHPKKALALTRSQSEAILGRVFARSVDWQVGDPLQLLSQVSAEIDVAASILPFGTRYHRPAKLATITGEEIGLECDLGQLILVATSQKLSATGIGLFIIPATFFSSQRSALRHFNALGLGIEAAFALPSAAFAPYTNISTYLAVVRRHPIAKLFVAQLSNEFNTNRQIVANLKQGKEGGSLELGRLVDAGSFVGLGTLRIEERVKEAQERFRAPAIRLQELSTAVNLGRPEPTFSFQKLENAVFVPLIGISDVRESVEDLSLKGQNYAQVVIDPSRSDARFVAMFLNSELGKEIREINKSGMIPKLTKQSLMQLLVIIPDLQTQHAMLETEARIAAEQNTLLSLQNELRDFRRDLCRSPQAAADVDQQLRNRSSRLTPGLVQYAVARLDQWIETLPFPLASILRAWQATPSQDFKTKYEHLLHFFEATAEFLSVILLSAFSSREPLFEEHKEKLAEALSKRNLSFRRATFGTWKVVVEYLAKQTRELLGGDQDSRALCSGIFADPTLMLPEMLGRTEIARVLSATNKMRNEWTGHGGIVGQAEARLRNEQLLSEVQKLQESMADTWMEIQLIHALHCRPRRGIFENEVAVLMGSNSEFLKETREMSTWLDVERLYMMRNASANALQLLPLVQIGPSPTSAKNACYFFSRAEKDGLWYVSYHFVDKPERKEPFEEVSAAVKFVEQY
jgi:hypothetical protein